MGRRPLPKAKTRLAAPRGTSPDVARAFKAIVGGYAPGFFTPSDAPVIKALAAIHLELDVASEARDLEQLDALTTVACRLRRSLSIQPTHQQSRGKIQRKAEHGTAANAGKSTPASTPAAPAARRGSWRDPEPALH